MTVNVNLSIVFHSPVSIMFRLRRELKEVKNLKIWQQEN